MSDDRIDLRGFPKWSKGVCTHPFKDCWVRKPADGEPLFKIENHNRASLVSRKGGLPITLHPRRVCNCQSAFNRETKLAKEEKRRVVPAASLTVQCVCIIHTHTRAKKNTM